MKFVRRILLLIFTTGVLYLDAQESAFSDQKQNRQTIDSLVRTAMNTYDIPAISVGVIQNGKATILKGYDFAKRGTEKTVNEHSSYQIEIPRPHLFALDTTISLNIK